MRVEPYILLILIVLTAALSVSIVYAQSESHTGLFNISNAAPDAPYSWSNDSIHSKDINFSWYQPTDPNGDPITTYICITNDTDTDSCDVVDVVGNPDEFWYKFFQNESNWDYGPFGSPNRTYYVKLVPNDGTSNGTANTTIEFTLYNHIPYIVGETNNATSQGDSDEGEDVIFYMTSHGDDDSGDNQSIKVCNTPVINTDGSCGGTELCNSGPYSTAANLNCTYTTSPSDNTSNLVYYFICDCVPGDLTCPSTCSGSYTTTFWVNHAPNATNVDVLPDGPTSAVNLNCSYTFNDLDGDAEGASTYRWFNWSGGNWVLTGYTNQILPLAATSDGQTWQCEVTPIDAYGLAGPAVNSTNESIGNAAPNQPQNFMVQDGVTSYDGSASPDTHDYTPFMNWTVTDPDFDSVTTYVCIATNATARDNNICDANYTTTTTESVTILSGLALNGTSVTYYVRLTPNDGNQNGTALDTNITLINQFPNIPSTLNPTSTHNQTPDLSWIATDPDDGSADRWPADSLTYHIRVGTSYGNGAYESNDNADKTGELVDNPIPWGTPGAVWANNTVFVSIWTTDGHTGGVSPYYNNTLVLSDYLPDITAVEMTDIGAYSTCTAAPSGCALNPVEGTNTTAAVRITATDTDQDCDVAGSTANIYLCTYATGTCNTTLYNHTWTVDSVSRVGSTCTYVFSVNKTAADSTPAFFIPANDSYQLRAKVTSQAGERTSDTEQNRLWEYGLLKAIDYPPVVLLGGGNPTLGVWNNGTQLYVLTNYGNDNLNLQWNTTDPTSGADTWVLNSTDLQLDDDNDHWTEGSGAISPIFMNATLTTFEPAGGLDACVNYACSNAAVNETLDTHYHAAPPFGLTAGQYNSTITIEVT